ncbi:hypothetical protein B296_00057403 [Ensete ventricosum]|uniref:chorismate synthase n=1 Tax=Ensete ventricosum TaxID=4639 RepID=A0A426XNY6_ENSVE|nr:hypothetical protein B296_00057403 [Ensete ventricosum]
MASAAKSSLPSSKPFVAGSRTDGVSGLASRLPSTADQISIRRRISPAPRRLGDLFSSSYPLPSIFKRTEVRAGGDKFGKHFEVTTYGESHGGGVGCIISGCPPRIPLSEEDLQFELDRRF